MEQLPKIVSQRLQAVSRPDAHPDANLLTAFAEKSLLPREHTQVLDHLAGCAVCREVVAHAQPEEVLERVAVAATAPISAPRNSWFARPWERWIALAACVAVVGTIVISRTQFERAPVQKVAVQAESSVVAKTETQPARSVPSPEESNEKQSERDYGRLKGAMSVGTRRDADELSKLDKEGPSSIAKGLPDEKRKKDTPAIDLYAKNSPAAVAESVTVNAEAAAQTVVPQQQEDAKASEKEFSADKVMKAPAATNQVVVQAQAAAVPAAPASQPSPVLADRQKSRSESGDVNSLSSYVAKDGYVSGAAIGGLMRSAAPRWQLSPEGKLIKSNDLGKSWQIVPVAEKIVFRALCVTGQEVWVGGAQGNLFYSSDAGQQWEQVKPMANGQTLTADIAAIEFKDPQHGKLTTADHQAWITSDGGHAWQVETR